jgi:hypothetical protein
VFAPIENFSLLVDLKTRKPTKMKQPLEEAAELFRENEALAGTDTEKANLYRGLTLLAEGMRRLEQELAEVEVERQDGPASFYQRDRTRLIREEGQVVPPEPSR